MFPITWFFETFWLRRNTLLYKSQALLYEVLGAPTDSFSLASFLFLLRLRLYIIFCLYPLLFLALQLLSSLRVVFLLILRLPEQIASSCFLILKNFKTADLLFCARHARRFARGRRQFVASSSFNPFPLDRLLGRPTPPWVP